MKSCLKYFIPFLTLLVLAWPQTAKAQFKEEAFSQQYNDERDSTMRDSTDAMWTWKEFMGGVRHKSTERIGVLFAGSTLFVGTGQMYNRDYWKLPIIYGGITAGVAGGVYFNRQYQKSGDEKDKNMRNLSIGLAALSYWGSLFDEVANYDKGVKSQAGKATLYAALLPGLGQAYNHEYWKIPIYYGCLLGSTHYYLVNNKNYQRYRRIYNEASLNENYDGPVSAETALFYRNIYRRYRDYSILAIGISYLLQIIDANVFAYMGDFDLDDNLSMQIQPAVIAPGDCYASIGSSAPAGYGISIGLRF